MEEKTQIPSGCNCTGIFIRLIAVSVQTSMKPDPTVQISRAFIWLRLHVPGDRTEAMGTN